MIHVAAFSKVTCCAAIVVLLASACGGNSFSGHENPQAGSSSGGSGNVAGKTSGGTTSQAGTASHGGTTSSAGTSSGGSPGGDACNAMPESGNCEAYFERWYHDPATGLCRSFVYGGCGGNENNYQTFEECQKACPSGTPNYDVCSKPTDCTISGGGCCGLCDSPDLRARDLIAYNKQYANNIFQCAQRIAPPDIACVPCPPLAGDSGSLKYFVANCVQGACVVEDLRTSAVSLCEVNEDCRLRNGSSCCEGCSGSTAIAINVSGAFEKLVCGDAPVACPACVPAPVNAVAYCNATNHCEAVYAIDAADGAK
jgi:hypothetical protein